MVISLFPKLTSRPTLRALANHQTPSSRISRSHEGKNDLCDFVGCDWDIAPLTFQPINYIYTEPPPGVWATLHCANITRLKRFDSFQVSLETPISWRNVLGVFGFDILKNIRKNKWGWERFQFPYASGPTFPQAFVVGKITQFLLKIFWISFKESACGPTLELHPLHRNSWPLGPFQTLGRTQTLVGSRFEGINTPHFLYKMVGTQPEGFQLSHLFSGKKETYVE